jgi:VCBS repeat-containing protein
MWFPKFSAVPACYSWSRLCGRLNLAQASQHLLARRRKAVSRAGKQIEELERRIVLASDFGDAPLPYPTTIAENGAQHVAVGPTLGSQRDTEANGIHSTTANGDDTTGNPDDEDGVTFGTLQIGSLDATATVNIQGAPTGAKLNAWIDFNGDGSWGAPGEQIAGNVTVVNGNTTITFDIPSGATSGTTYARFRLNTGGNLGPEGAATDGEVEDYSVTLLPPAVATTPFTTSHVISTTADTTFAVVAADLDGDGDMDLVSAERNRVSWYQNDGQQQFTQYAISTSVARAESVFVIDLDNDGDLDVLSASSEDSTIAWYENTAGSVFISHIITTDTMQPLSVFAADMDGDGDIDVLSASRDNQIIWYPNDGNQVFGSITINNLSYGAAAVFAADVDSDGDMDVVTASSYDNTVAWLENDGDQNFTLRTISTEAAGVFAVFATDVDNDGDIDIISGSPEDDTVAWYENDGTQQFTKHVLSTTSDGVFGIYAADVDGDGDTDILAASAFNNTVAWFENDGARNFSPHTISNSAAEAGSVITADMDGDGDLDAVAASAADNTIAWFESVNLVTLSVSAAAGSESGTTVITVTATVETPMNSDRTVGLNVTGDGVSSGDYSLSANVITILSGQLTGSVTFTIVNDTVVEGLETATLTLVNPSPGLNLDEPSSRSISITDDDLSTLTIDNVGIDEGNSGVQAMTFEVRSPNAVDGGFTVAFSVENITTSNNDYVLLTSGPLTFQGTANEVQTITVNVIGDIELELTEMFSVTLGAVSPFMPGAPRNIGTGASAFGVIFDDETPTISITTIDNALEGGVPTNGRLRVLQSALTSSDTVVNYTVSGTAGSGAGNDYAGLTGTVTIPAGQRFADIMIAVFDDEFVEGTESVAVTLVDLADHDPAVTLHPDPNRLTAEVTITDDDKPAIVSSANVTVPENTPTSVTILDVDAITLPSDFPLSYSLSGLDAALFQIDETTGELTFSQSPDFESPDDSDHNNVYQVTVTATAPVNPASSVSQGVTITVSGVNDNAPVINSPSTASVAENSALGSLILQVNATDADLPTAMLTYNLSGLDADQFDISSTGVLTFKASPDYENPLDQGGDNVYQVTVTATDDGVEPLTVSQDLTITVTGINDSGPAFLNLTPTFSIVENSLPGLEVGSVSAVDLDQPTQTLTYSISQGNDSGAFAINSATGTIKVANAGPLDFETIPTFHLTVQVADNHGATDTATVTVNLTDVDESIHLTRGGPGVTWINKQSPVVVLPQLSATSGGNLTGGTLSFSINAVGTAKKLLDQIHLPSSASLGTTSGPQFANGHLTLQIQLGANATNAAIQSFLRGLTFATKGKGLKTLTRTLEVTLSAGGQSSAITQTINVRKKA